MSRIDEQTDGIATSISSVALMSEIGMHNRASEIMLLRDRGCVRPLFVYATVYLLKGKSTQWLGALRHTVRIIVSSRASESEVLTL